MEAGRPAPAPRRSAIPAAHKLERQYNIRPSITLQVEWGEKDGRISGRPRFGLRTLSAERHIMRGETHTG